MRTLSAAQQAVWDSGNQAEFVRVSVKDGGGTFRDLTTYPGFNAVKSVTWAEAVDGPHMTCDFDLLREQDRSSLAPFVETSPLNKGFDPAAGAVPLLALNREVKVEVAIVSMDRQPASGDWMEVFRGRVDSISPTADIRVGCRSLGGRLAQQYIKTELVYSHASVTGVAVPLRVWEPQMVVVLNSYLLPASRGTEDPGYNKFLKCSQAGTTGTSEPVWTTGANQSDGTAKWDYIAAPTTSGNPVEQVMQNILNDHKAAGDSTVTLYTPASPSWAIKQFIQQREFVLDAVMKLAKQIGWDVRYKWRAGTAQFEFTFYAPDRASSTTQFTFQTSDYEDPSTLAQNIAEIRNAWRLVYTDAGDLWPDGQPKRKVIEVSDSSSITKYGELWAEIQEDSASGIDSSTEATALVNAALSDCKEPTVQLSAALVRGFPWVELNDRNAFKANNLHFTSDQTLAVTGWSHTFEGGRLKTTLNLRGQPTIGTTTWLERTVHPTVIPAQSPPQWMHFNGPQTQTLILTPAVGGLAIGASSTQDKARIQDDEMELHISTTPSFTPSAGTLKGVVRGGSPFMVMADLIPGKTHYAKSVPRSHHKNKSIRGQPSVEKTLAAGRASAGHLDSQVVLHGPPNGKFQHALDNLASFPPDHWTVTAGSWAEAGDLYYGSTTTNGRHVACRQTGTVGKLRSGAWPIPRGTRRAKLFATVRPQGTLSAGRDLQFHLSFWAEESLTTEVGGGVDVAAPYNIAGANVWADYSTDINVPAAANFARIEFYKATNSSAYGFDLAGVYFEPSVPLSVEDWIAVSFANSFGDFGGGYSPCSYAKDSMGFVRLRGLATRASAALSTAMFTLPTGYRPAYSMNFVITAGGRSAALEILTTGVVDVYAADGAAWWSDISLEGLGFDTRT